MRQVVSITLVIVQFIWFWDWCLLLILYTFLVWLQCSTEVLFLGQSHVEKLLVRVTHLLVTMKQRFDALFFCIETRTRVHFLLQFKYINYTKQTLGTSRFDIFFVVLLVSLLHLNKVLQYNHFL